MLTRADRWHLPFWVWFMDIDAEILNEIMADAKRHHPEESLQQLRQRAIYRYAQIHSWHWRKYLLLAGLVCFVVLGLLVYYHG